MDSIQFNWTLNLGHVINLTLMFIGGVMFFASIKYNVRAVASRMTNIETSLTKVDTALSTQTTILIELARQDERLKRLEASPHPSR